MPVQEIHQERDTPAPREAVWALLSNSSTWPAWTPIDEHTAVAPAGPDGTGEVRLFKNGRHTIREEIVEHRAPERLAYTVIGGLAVRDYRAVIDLTPNADGGTHIRWHTTFKPKVPGLGWAYRRELDKATIGFIDGLARHATRP